jgi:hypothetical protein
MPVPRKRLTTQKLASLPPELPLAQNKPKSIANPDYYSAAQLIENKATSQKSIANFCAFPLLPFQIFRVSTKRQINRHTVLLEITVTHGKQTTSPFLIATKNRVSRTLSGFHQSPLTNYMSCQTLNPAPNPLTPCLPAIVRAIPFHPIAPKEHA